MKRSFKKLPILIAPQFAKSSPAQYWIKSKRFWIENSPESGQTSAVIYSLIETCRKLDINPADYLREVLEALPTMMSEQAPDWTPSKWKKRLEKDAS